MALVKCKECGESVSNKAKTCPSCGAKPTKKTSILTWAVLIIFGFVGYAATKSSSTTYESTASTSNSSGSKPSSTRTEPMKPTWISTTSKDEMTGKLSAFARSPYTEPTKRMGFPYGDVRSWIAVGCDATSEWVYFGFNNAPNLSNTETKDKYNLIKTRISWDDNVENISLTQDWGAKFIHFRDYVAAVSKVEASGSTLLELQWHGEQSVYFKYDLNGSSKAIAEIRSKCATSK